MQIITPSIPLPLLIIIFKNPIGDEISTRTRNRAQSIFRRSSPIVVLPTRKFAPHLKNIEQNSKQQHWEKQRALNGRAAVAAPWVPRKIDFPHPRREKRTQRRNPNKTAEHMMAAFGAAETADCVAEQH